MSDPDNGKDIGNRSGGGIVFGGGSRSTARGGSTAPEIVAGLRRRWASGVAIVTGIDAGGGKRGVTVSSLMVVSQEPAVIALALTAASSFQELAVVNGVLGVSLLDSGHQFPAERFAGRAPLPDAQFTGVAHHLIGGIPVLDDALSWCVGRVRRRDDVGDHVLVLLDVDEGGIGPDTDDPLLNYEGRYRRLEAG